MEYNLGVEPAEEVSLDEVMQDNYDLIIYNDDVNTFEHVIESLVEVCDHNPLQAEQCAFIIHHKGKCSVKRGSYDQLEPMCTSLLDRQLSAKIEA